MLVTNMEKQRKIYEKIPKNNQSREIYECMYVYMDALWMHIYWLTKVKIEAYISAQKSYCKRILLKKSSFDFLKYFA